MTSRKPRRKAKAVKPIKAWAVVDCINRPYLDSIAPTRAEAITHYVGPRNYSWDACVHEDGARVRKITITIDEK